MNKEEIKHFKSLLRQGSLRHMNILLDDKFQKELLTIIKDYEKLQQENEKLKDNWNYIKKMLKEARQEKYISGYCGTCTDVDIDFLLGKMRELQGSNSNE